MKGDGRMKKSLIAVGTALALMLGLVSATPAAAAPSASKGQAAAAEAISSIDHKLEAQGKNVDSALDELARYYENELRTNKALTSAQRKGIKQNLKVLAEVRRSYVVTKSRVIPTDGGDVLPGPILPPMEPALAAAVAAVIAYFWANGYVFATDLLVHALVSDGAEIYYPMHHVRVQESPLYPMLQNAPEYEVMGAAFEASSSPVEQDLYYAVHNFNYMKEGPYVLSIWDEYDWAANRRPETLEEAAVATMAAASARGIIRDYRWQMVFS